MVAVSVAAILLAVAGAVGLARADEGFVRRIVVVDGVPLHEVRPSNASGPLPGVVVAHGFAGSARLMYPFADTLARNGYVVVLPDLTGHGANPRRMSTRDLLQRDLAVALRHLRSLPSVAADRVALLGHSMGAGAVITYAAQDPSVPATVAISLSDAAGLPAGADRPRNLLLLYGALEFPRFPEAAGQLLRSGYPDGRLGQTYGDPASGTARRAVAVPASEHISVLYMTRTHAETIGWLDATLRPGQPQSSTTEPRRRLVPGTALLLAFALGGYPLAVALLRWRRRVTLPEVPATAFGVGLAVALGLAVGLVEVVPTTRLPLAVGGYLAGFFAIAAAGLFVAWLLARRPSNEPRATSPRERARMAVATVLFTVYAAAAVAVPVHLSTTHAAPGGQRWWLLAAVAAALVALLWTAELFSAGNPWLHATVLVVTVAVLLLATVVGLAPGFLLFVLPLLAILLAWQAGWAAVVRRHGAPPWAGAVAGGVLVAWPLVASLPLV